MCNVIRDIILSVLCGRNSAEKVSGVALGQAVTLGLGAVFTAFK